jgi:hypothetical protein
METADGSLTVEQPCPPGVTYCLRISSRSLDVPRPTIRETVSAIARALAGAQPAAASMPKPRLPDRPPKLDPGRLEAMNAAGFDIAPGLSVPSTFDSATWTEVRRARAGARCGAMRSHASLGGTRARPLLHSPPTAASLPAAPC